MTYSMFLLIWVCSLRTVDCTDLSSDTFQIPALFSEPVYNILNITPECKKETKVNASDEDISSKYNNFNHNLSSAEKLIHFDNKDPSSLLMGECTTERAQVILSNQLNGNNDNSLYSMYQKDFGFFYYTLKTTRLYPDCRDETTESIYRKLALSRSNYTSENVKVFEMAMNTFFEQKSNISEAQAPSVQSVTTPRASLTLPPLFSKQISTTKMANKMYSSVAEDTEKAMKCEQVCNLVKAEETSNVISPEVVSRSNLDVKSNRVRNKRSVNNHELRLGKNFDNSDEMHIGFGDAEETDNLELVNFPSDIAPNYNTTVRKGRKLNTLNEIYDQIQKSLLESGRDGFRELTKRDSEERGKVPRTRGERKRGKQSGKKQQGRRRPDGRRRDKSEEFSGDDQNEENSSGNFKSNKSDLKKSKFEALSGDNVTMKEISQNHFSRRLNDSIKTNVIVEDPKWSQPVNKLFKQLNKTIPIFSKNDTFNIVYGVPRAVNRIPITTETTTNIMFPPIPNRNFNFNLPMKPRDEGYGLMNQGSRPEWPNYFPNMVIPPPPPQSKHPEMPISPRFPNIAVLPKSGTNYMATSDRQHIYSTESRTEAKYTGTDKNVEEIWRGRKKSKPRVFTVTEKKRLSRVSLSPFRIPFRNSKRQEEVPVPVPPPDSVPPPPLGDEAVAPEEPPAQADAPVQADSVRSETTTKGPPDERKYNIAGLFFTIFRNPLFWIVTIPILIALMLLFVTMLILCRIRGACCRRFICCPPCCEAGVAPSPCNKKYKVILIK